MSAPQTTLSNPTTKQTEITTLSDQHYTSNNHTIDEMSSNPTSTTSRREFSSLSPMNDRYEDNSSSSSDGYMHDLSQSQHVSKRTRHSRANTLHDPTLVSLTQNTGNDDSSPQLSNNLPSTTGLTMDFQQLLARHEQLPAQQSQGRSHSPLHQPSSSVTTADQLSAIAEHTIYHVDKNQLFLQQQQQFNDQQSRHHQTSDDTILHQPQQQDVSSAIAHNPANVNANDSTAHSSATTSHHLVTTVGTSTSVDSQTKTGTSDSTSTSTSTSSPTTTTATATAAATSTTTTTARSRHSLGVFSLADYHDELQQRRARESGHSTGTARSSLPPDHFQINLSPDTLLPCAVVPVDYYEVGVDLTISDDYPLGSRILPNPDIDHIPPPPPLPSLSQDLTSQQNQPLTTRFAIRLIPRLPKGINETNIQMHHLFKMADYELDHLTTREFMMPPDQFNVDHPDHDHIVKGHIDSPIFAQIFKFTYGAHRLVTGSLASGNYMVPPTLQGYAQIIYENQFTDEVKYSPLPTYLDDVQTTLTSTSRAKIADWITELAYLASIPARCIYFTMMVLDRFLSQYDVHSPRLPLELWALGCVSIALKFDNMFPLHVDKLLRHVNANRYTPGLVFTAERFILKTLDYHICVPTSLEFLEFIFPYADLTPTGQLMAKFILEVAIQQPFALHHRTSSLAASVLFITRFILCTQAALGSNYTIYTSVYENHLALLREHNQQPSPFFHPIFKSFLPFVGLPDEVISEAVKQSWPASMVNITGYQLPLLASCVISICAALVNVMGFGPNLAASHYNNHHPKQMESSPSHHPSNDPNNLANQHCLSEDILNTSRLPQNIYTMLYRMNTLWEYGCDRVALGNLLIPIGPHAPLVHSTRAVFVKYAKQQFESISLRFLPPFDLRYHHLVSNPLDIQPQKERYTHPKRCDPETYYRVTLPYHPDFIPTHPCDVAMLSSKLALELDRQRQLEYTYTQCDDELRSMHQQDQQHTTQQETIPMNSTTTPALPNPREEVQQNVTELQAVLQNLAEQLEEQAKYVDSLALEYSSLSEDEQAYHWVEYDSPLYLSPEQITNLRHHYQTQSILRAHEEMAFSALYTTSSRPNNSNHHDTTTTTTANGGDNDNTNAHNGAREDNCSHMMTLSQDSISAVSSTCTGCTANDGGVPVVLSLSQSQHQQGHMGENPIPLSPPQRPTGHSNRINPPPLSQRVDRSLSPRDSWTSPISSANRSNVQPSINDVLSPRPGGIRYLRGPTE